MVHRAIVKVSILALVLIFCLIPQAHSGHVDRNLRIVGGSIARNNQFPHAVALVLHLTESRSSFCGGSIVHPSYVLTVSVIFSYF